LHGGDPGGFVIAVLLLIAAGIAGAAADLRGSPPLAMPQSGRTSPPPLVIASKSGRDLYGFYCASCHGRDARGDGPVAPALKSVPPDLTRISLRNGGVFPRARVEAILLGRAKPPLAAHGSREMPVWGPIFQGLDADEAVNLVRIANIVDYVESLQLKHARTHSRPDRITPTISPKPSTDAATKPATPISG
jgi:mono/diheme cytochrome c family protein